MRVTIDITPPILDELKQITKKNGGTLDELVNRLLAEGLKSPHALDAVPELVWTSQAMGARVDLSDKDAVETLLDVDDR